MNTEHESHLLDELRKLPAPPADPERAARTLRRARSIYLETARHARPDSWSARVGRVYYRLEPILVTFVGVMYLGFALDTVRTLLR